MKKKLKITLNAPFTLGFALLCGLATLLCAVSGECTVLLFSTHASSMSDPLMYLRLFTHVLGHSGLDHLMGNMAMILLLGPALEEKYGWKILLTLILATALITGIIHNLLFPGSALLGASGVAFAFVLLTSFTAFREGEIPLTFILVALIYLGQQIWDAVTVRDNVSNLTHIIGGLIGGGAGYLLNMKTGSAGFSNR
jgi:GlpG protein